MTLPLILGYHPHLPPPRGRFVLLTEAQFICVVRKVQGFSEKRIAQERGCQPETVKAHVRNARKVLGFEQARDLMVAFSIEYCPELWLEPTAIRSVAVHYGR